MRKASKSEVDYSRGMRESHCGKAFEDDKYFYRHFIPPAKSVPCFGVGYLLGCIADKKAAPPQGPQITKSICNEKLAEDSTRIRCV
jgi:hypothetical protein